MKIPNGCGDNSEKFFIYYFLPHPVYFQRFRFGEFIADIMCAI